MNSIEASREEMEKWENVILILIIIIIKLYKKKINSAYTSVGGW